MHARWEDQDPVIAIDAQIDILKAARIDVRAELPKAEELAVRAMAVGSSSSVREACDIVQGLRAASHDFTLLIDELQTERRLLLPTQRAPCA